MECENFLLVLNNLEEALALPIVNQRDVAGIIKNFEFVYELAWRLLKAELSAEGIVAGSPKDVFAKSYQTGFIDNEEVWLAIIGDRNLTLHTYNEELAKKIVANIRNIYMKDFLALRPLATKPAA